MLMRLLISLFLFFSFQSVFAERYALVIGNESYIGEYGLSNPHNDANVMEGLLKRAGFTVTNKRDLNLRQMRQSIRNFTANLGKGDIAVFYYSGHAVQAKGSNYLLPIGSTGQINFKNDSEDELSDDLIEYSYNVDGLLRKITRRKSTNIVFLDACRTNPFAEATKGWGGKKGLAPIPPQPDGTLIAYAAKAGTEAYEGVGEKDNSPYVLALKKYLLEPRSLTDILNLVRGDVRARTQNRQSPDYDPGIDGIFCLTECSGNSSNIASSGNNNRSNNSQFSSLGLKMVRIKGGTFQMGCVSGKNCQDHENPVHTVRVKSFYMGATEVTFAQWDACVAAGACSHKPDDKGWGRGNRPVMNVSWNDTQEFIAWLRQLTGKAYRLPTEAEWEYAARGGTTTQYSWGNSIGSNKANCKGCGSRWDGKKTAPVASFSAYNGLYDMQGNVWEWTCSAYTKKYNGSEGKCINNNDSQSYPVLRGGSWYFLPNFLRSAYRFGYFRAYRDIDIGFRIARTR